MHFDFREITIFPGIELSVGRVHYLAIFDPSTEVSAVERFLGAAKYRGTNGASDGTCETSITDICTEIQKLGGILIPAHVDSPTGAFVELRGNDMKPLLDCDQIVAMELITEGYTPPALCTQRGRHWSRVLGSDSHHPASCPGMQTPRFPGHPVQFV